MPAAAARETDPTESARTGQHPHAGHAPRTVGRPKAVVDAAREKRLELYAARAAARSGIFDGLPVEDV